MVPAEAVPKIFKVKRRGCPSKILAVSLKHWKGRRGGVAGVQRGGGALLLRCTAVLIHPWGGGGGLARDDLAFGLQERADDSVALPFPNPPPGRGSKDRGSVILGPRWVGGWGGGLEGLKRNQKRAFTKKHLHISGNEISDMLRQRVSIS